MGQYYLPVNLDKKQYIHNQNFGGGLKLCEHGGMILNCLVALLADGNGRGSGDLDSNNPIIGSWAGDRIMFAGDYADPRPEFAKPTPVWNERKHTWENGPLSEDQTIYRLAREEWRDISLDIFLAMLEDPLFKDEFDNTYIAPSDTWYREWYMPDVLVTLAYALKNIEELPQLGNKGAWAWRVFFEEGTQEYYRAMHGLVKHHKEPRLYKKLRDLELGLDKTPV